MFAASLLAAGFYLNSVALTSAANSDAALTLGVQPTPLPITDTYSTSGGQTGSIYVKNSSGTPIWENIVNLWGLTGTPSGSASMSYTGSGSEISTVDFTGLTENQTVVGGPEMWLGCQYNGTCSGNTCTAGSCSAGYFQGLTFPIQLRSLDAFTIDTAYSFDFTSSEPSSLDVLVDDWITPSATYSGGAAGAIECGIDLYVSYGHAGTDFTIPVTVNGVTTNKTFKASYNDEPIGSTPTVIFYPAGGGTQAGEFSVNLLPFFQYCVSEVPNANSSWYLSGLVLSDEWGTGSNGPTSLDFMWTITKLRYMEVTY